MPKLLTSRGDYGLLLMTFLANQPRGEPRPISEVASFFGLSRSFLEQIALDLRRSRLIAARRGRDGGYFLARDPEMIGIIEVIEVLEGPLQIVACHGDECTSCSRCFTRGFWQVFQKYLHKTLREITVADLLDKSPHKLLPLAREKAG